MAYPDKRRKVLHYRHAVMLPEHNKLTQQTLQTRMSFLLEHELTLVKDRVYFPDEADNHSIIEMDTRKNAHLTITECHTENNVFCAQLAYIEPGNSIPVISNNDYAKTSLDVEALKLNEAQSKEYLDSIAFIQIVNNHIIILQSKTIRIKDLEEYINYLLRNNNKLAEAEFIILQANNLELNDSTLRNKKIKNVNLQLPLSVSTEDMDDNAAFEVLSSLIGHQRLEELKQLQTSRTNDLKIDINIGYKYNTTDVNQHLLSKITQDLIDNRDESLTIELKGAGKLVGDEIQLKNDTQIPYHNRLPVPEHVYSIMLDWLIDLLDQGVINP